MIKILIINGMHCSSCAKSIELELEDSVNSIKVDYNSSKCTLDFNEKRISKEQVIGIIENLGFKIKEVK